MAMEGNRFIYMCTWSKPALVFGARLCDPHLGTVRRSSTRNARLSGEKTLDISWHSSWSGFSQNYGYHSGSVWRNFAWCPFSVYQFHCASMEWFPLRRFCGNVIQSSPSRLGKTNPRMPMWTSKTLWQVGEYVGPQTPNKIPYSKGDWSILEADMLCKNDHLKFWPMENHSVSQFFWWASEICARLWADKDQSFAILFADLFLIEPSKKARLRGDDVFFQGFCQCRWATNLFVL